jgi:transposase
VITVRREISMGRPRPFPENAIPELKAARARARTKGQHERVLCLWLRAALGLDARQVATALGWSVQAVYNFHARYLKEGLAVLEGPGRGGRRHRLLKPAEEKALLRRVHREASPDILVDFAAVHAAVEEAVGRPVPSATVHRLLDRNRWRVHAIALAPRGELGMPEEKPVGSFARRGIQFFPSVIEE